MKKKNPIGYLSVTVHVMVSVLFSLLCYSQFLRRRRRREMEISRENSELVPKSNVNTIAGDEGVEVNDTPIEEVRLTVPIKDDPNEPTLTFRTWVLGISCCCVLSFVNQFLGYKQNRLSVGSVLAQILTLPLGKLMAATLPEGHFRFPFTKWSFTMNPGPFSVKEHVLITISANSGASSVYAMSVLAIVKAYYHRYINPVAAMLLVLTTQMLGYGWAGMFRRYLVDSPYMWWPSNLVQVSLFRSLHEKEKRPRQGLTRLQFFVMFLICSFVYNIVPAYLFHSISTLSSVCWIWKDSITAHQVGSGLHGLGIGSISLDWSTAAGFLRSPLAVPGFAIINILVGFFMIVYIVIPIAYWCNAYEAKRFPLFSSHTFDSSGKTYNLSRIINSQTFDIDVEAYNSYSKLYLSIVFAFSYGLSFATLMATISHVALFNGKNIWQMWKKTAHSYLGDVHTRIMSKSYKATPQWWFGSILACMVALALFTCEGFGNDLQLRWWGVLLACFIALFFTLPVGVIKATTNMEPGLNVITELIIGYLYPGKPLANVVFKTYGYSSMAQALTFLQDLKLGTYMKIPPKDMFIVQLVSSVVASTCYFGTGWYLLTTVENICNPAMLPKGSPWTCPGDDVFYNASIIWGVVGPLRMFTKLGNYPELNWFFLIGALAPVPVWLLSRKFPNKEWMKLINMPLILGATHNMPPARSINFLTWGAVGVLFNIYIYGKCKKWWARHNYVLSAALDAGVAFNGIVLFFALQSNGILGPSWWGLETEDHCPLATCPTAPGIVAQNCPKL